LRNCCLYIVLLLLWSCKKEIKIEVQDHPAQLVVNADLDPDSLVYFNLSLTQNITDNQPIPYVTDANIEMYNNDTVLVAVLNHTSGGDYRSVFLKPKPGEHYYFKILTSSQTYWFDEYIPDTFTCSIDTATGFFLGKRDFFKITAKIYDKKRGDNYYGFRLKRFFETYQGTDTTRSEEWISMETLDFVLTENPKSKFSKKNILFTDEYFNDANNKDLKIGAAGMFTNPGQKTTRLVLYTTSYTLEGYNYYTSVNEHLFYQNDPFSQPTLLVGNIPGAYGAAVGKFNRVSVINFK
jgi:hypothetical protein